MIPLLSILAACFPVLVGCVALEWTWNLVWYGCEGGGVLIW